MAKGQIQGCTGRKGQSWNLNLGLSDYRNLTLCTTATFSVHLERGREEGGEQRKRELFSYGDNTPVSIYTFFITEENVCGSSAMLVLGISHSSLPSG